MNPVNPVKKWKFLGLYSLFFLWSSSHCSVISCAATASSAHYQLNHELACWYSVRRLSKPGVLVALNDWQTCAAGDPLVLPSAVRGRPTTKASGCHVSMAFCSAFCLDAICRADDAYGFCSVRNRLSSGNANALHAKVKA